MPPIPDLTGPTMTDQQAREEANRIISEKLLPIIRGETSGPLIYALGFALVDVAREHGWPKKELMAFVDWVHDEHKRLDTMIAKAGQG